MSRDGREWKVERIEVFVFVVPTDAPEQDGTLDWNSTTAIVVRAWHGDLSGLGYTYGHRAAAALIIDKLAPLLVGSSFAAPAGQQQAMRRAIRNSGDVGLGALAVSALDTALWDLKAQVLEVSLATLLGPVRACTPIYGSGGFTSYGDQQLRRQLDRWMEAGIPRVKIKVGRDPPADHHRVKTAREAIGPDVALFVDANGAYAPKQALHYAQRFKQEWNVTWLEEPRPSEDHETLRWLRDCGPAGLEIAAGEYGYRLSDFRALLQAGAVDVLQVDATRCGGVTGFLAAAAVAEGFGMEVSAHCAPALHSVLGAATPGVRHVEYFHDHVRVEEFLFDGLPEQVDGTLQIRSTDAGLGLKLKPAQDVQRWLVEQEVVA